MSRIPDAVVASTVAKLTNISPKAATLLPASAVKAQTIDPSDTPRYERIDTLGEGGMGVVERARDRDLLREVAVKHLRRESFGDPAMLEQFLWEARVTAYLDHPNIVPVHDIGTSAGQLFFTMKLVRGRTLEAVIRDSAIDLPRRLRTFLQVCNAIAFAHSKGVLHRDLKPANIMVGEYGEVLVTDWGVAFPLESAKELRRIAPDMTGKSGTPMYMSPEQARGDALDARSDIYALGAILYELVAGEPAVTGANVPEVLSKIISGDIRRLEKGSLEAVVSRAMALERANRYADVAALGRDVETVLEGRTPSAEQVSMARRFGRFYLARDPALGRLRVWEIDLWVGAGVTIGIGIGVYVARFLGTLGWLFVVIGLLAAAIPTARWLGRRRE